MGFELQSLDNINKFVVQVESGTIHIDKEKSPLIVEAGGKNFLQNTAKYTWLYLSP
jgi:hypothetical protein